MAEAKVASNARRRMLMNRTRANAHVLPTPERISAAEVLQSFIRRANALEEHAQRGTMLPVRQRIIEELITTERSYAAGLTSLVEDIIVPLRALVDSPGHVVESSVVSKLFANTAVEMIQQISTQLLADLTKRAAERPVPRIGDILLNMSKVLNMYTVYVDFYPEIEDTLNLVKQKREFIDFLQQQWGSTDVNRVASILITPVQRIPRYQMLLETLVKNTWKSHEDFHDLTQAHKAIIETAFYVNDHARQALNRRRLVLIDLALVGMKTSIVSHSREYVAEYAVEQFSRGEWKSRHFFLLTDLLIRAKAPKDYIPQNLETAKLTFLEKVPLRKLTTHLLDRASHPDMETDDVDAADSVWFEVRHPSVSYILRADPVTQQKMIAHLTQLIDSVLKAERLVDEERTRVSMEKAKQASAIIASQYISGSTRGRPTQTTADGVKLRAWATKKTVTGMDYGQRMEEYSTARSHIEAAKEADVAKEKESIQREQDIMEKARWIQSQISFQYGDESESQFEINADYHARTASLQGNQTGTLRARLASSKKATVWKGRVITGGGGSDMAASEDYDVAQSETVDVSASVNRDEVSNNAPPVSPVVRSGSGGQSGDSLFSVSAPRFKGRPNAPPRPATKAPTARPLGVMLSSSEDLSSSDGAHSQDSPSFSATTTTTSTGSSSHPSATSDLGADSRVSASVGKDRSKRRQRSVSKSHSRSTDPSDPATTSDSASLSATTRPHTHSHSHSRSRGGRSSTSREKSSSSPATESSSPQKHSRSSRPKKASTPTESPAQPRSTRHHATITLAKKKVRDRKKPRRSRSSSSPGVRSKNVVARETTFTVPVSGRSRDIQSIPVTESEAELASDIESFLSTLLEEVEPGSTRSPQAPGDDGTA